VSWISDFLEGAADYGVDFISGEMFGSGSTPTTGGSDIASTVSNVAGGLNSQKSGSNYNIFGDLIKGGLSAVSAYAGRPQSQLGYGQTQAGFEADLALQERALAQNMEIARMEAEAAGLGPAAAIQVANIQAGVAMKQLREKALADAISFRMQSFANNQSLLQKASQTSTEAAQKAGDMGRLGFGAMAQNLQGYRA